MIELPHKQFVINKIHESFDSTEYLENIHDTILVLYWEIVAQKYFQEIYSQLFTDLHIQKTYISYETKKMLEQLSWKI